MAARYRKHRGGYRFRRFAGAPIDEVEALGVPQTVRLKTPAPLTVKVGQQVKAGQIVAQGGTPPSSPVLATVSGTVQAVLSKGAELVLASDGAETVSLSERRYPSWRDTPRELLEDALYLSGITGHPAGGIPTRRGSSTVGTDDVTDVLIAALYADVWSPSLAVELDYPRLKSGIAILAKILPRAAFAVVVDRGERELGRSLDAELSGVAAVVAVPSRYPMGHEAMLVPSVLGRKPGAGRRAIDVGVLVMDIQTVQQIHDVVVEGRPPVERIIALAGPGFARRPHLRLRLGTAVSAVVGPYLGTTPSRVVINSPIAGEAVGDGERGVDSRCRQLVAIPENHDGELLAFARPGLVKDSFSRTFVAGLLPIAKKLDTNLHGEGRACISCGFCEEVCPAGILPQLLHRYVQKDMIDETLIRYRIQDCIDCNLCTYVCPSKIPVSDLLRKGKARLVEEGLVRP